MKKLLIFVFVVTLLQLGVVSASQAAPPTSGGNYYTVRYGDTLFSIGRHYGVNPYQIAHVNGLRDPNHIYAGQVLYIPSGYGYDDHSGNCYNNCGQWDNCGGGCNQQGYDRSRQDWNNCNDNCGWQDNRQDWNNCGSGCGRNDRGPQPGWGNCGSGCGSRTIQGYGYDYAGYYYYSHYPSYKRYSYTCGYYYNCY